jgi:integrase
MTGREITRREPEATAPLRVELVEDMRDFMTEARAERTRQAYGRAWAAFEAWCAAEGFCPLPADPAAVAAWIAALAKGKGPTRRPLSRSTINQYLSAVLLRHHRAGKAFDRKHPLIAETWQGLSRKKAAKHVERRATPIHADQLRRLLADLKPQLNADARDAALLALGWSAALRRSELVGLDWQEQGTGLGFLHIEERGLVVTLARSKGSQDAAVEVVVPCAEMPTACAAVKAWVERANLQPGAPLFRPIDKGQRIGVGRLTDHSVSRIIKVRVRAYAIANGMSKADAAKLVARISGHSLRAGYATAAAAEDVPSYRIQQHTRHKSAEMVNRYIREADKWTNGGLKGVGF